MFLSKVELNLRHRETYRLLADVYAQHRFVMSAFPNLPPNSEREQGAQRQLNVLYRVETRKQFEQVFLLVQSGTEPDWSKTEQFHPGVICNAKSGTDKRVFANGERYRFRLRANPTVCRVNRDATGKRNPKREGLFTEAAQLAWLVNIAERSGFRVNPEAILVTPQGKRDGAKQADSADGQRQSIKCFTVDFDGLLTVTDADLLINALWDGIGRGKAWGCGLLSLLKA